MNTALTLTHLRFDAIARTPIKLGREQAGERLRDALAQVMLRTVCPEAQRARTPSAEHVAACPVCWLLAANLDPGEVRRAYSLVPPLPAQDVIVPGQRFSFVLTLYGQGWQYLPYFVLAVPEMGQVGVGPGRGQFDLQAIWALNPLIGQAETVLAPGDRVVRIPQSRLDWDAVTQAAAALLPGLSESKGLRVRFWTPTRLIDAEALVKSPDFGVFFRRLLQRIDQLGQQHAGVERRTVEEVEYLHTLSDGVRLVETDTHWVELWGPSNRTGRSTPMGGFTGWAVYRARDWEPLLPWLLLGQAAQVGKLTVKGNGVYALSLPGQPDYWELIYSY